jgi:TRAP-type C4-dicarboxylate transport system substrate-binding protein
MQAIVQREFSRSSLEVREDVAKLNDSLRATLSTKNLVFNDVDPDAFRQALRKAGFYAEWKGKFGDEAWKTLEASVGALT